VVTTDETIDGRVSIDAGGATLGTPELAGRELTVPIIFIQAAKTIKVTYVGTAPAAASADATQIIVKSRGTATGKLAVVVNKSDPDIHLNYYPIAVGKAANGSGSVGVDVTTVTAGSIGNIFKITYKAVGELNGGRIQITRPNAGWTVIEPNISVNSANVLLDAAASGDDNAIYNITSLGKDEQIIFTYSGVEVPTAYTINNVIGFKVANDAEAFVAGDEVTTDFSIEAPILLRPNNAAAGITVDYAADGSGTLVINKQDSSEVVTSQASLEFQTLDIEYTPFAQMKNGKIVLQIPAGWTALRAVNDVPNVGDVRNIEVRGSDIKVEDVIIDEIAMTVTVKNINLGETQPVTIVYGPTTAPTVGGPSVFSLTSQGHGTINDPLTTDIDESLTSPTGRALVAVGSIVINVGDVLPGRGKAEIIYPVTQSAGTDTEVTTDDVFKREFLKGTTNERIVFAFEAVGPMSGADIKFSIPNSYIDASGGVSPQQLDQAGVAYARVTSAPVGRYPVLKLSNKQDKYLQLSGVTLTAGQRMEVTLANLSFPVEEVYDFLVQTRYDVLEPWSSGSSLSPSTNTLAESYAGLDLDGNALTKETYPLRLDIKSVEGTGTLAITPSGVFRHGVTKSFRLQYTAAAATGGIQIDLDSKMTAPVASTVDVPVGSNQPGFVRIEQLGGAGTGTLVVDAFTRTIRVSGLSLLKGHTITIGYSNATYAGDEVGAVTFVGRSTSDTGSSDLSNSRSPFLTYWLAARE